MKTALCACCRLENLYIREWVEYYKNLGFDNIILYDNNNKDEDKLSDVIGDYIDSGFVIVKPIPGLRCFQVTKYNECIIEYCNTYDWIAFFDCDEFLTLKQDDSISNYLSHFEYADQIQVNWLIYDDNDLATYENKPVLERFTRPCYTSNYFNYKMRNYSDNWHVKTIAHVSKNKNLRFGGQPHTCYNSIRAILNDGTPKNDPVTPFSPEMNYNRAYLKHFACKTIEEFINKKLRGKAPDISDESFTSRYNIDVFFRLNKRTPEKEEIIKKMLNK